MYYSTMDKTFIGILDRIEMLKEKIRDSGDAEETRMLKKQLNRLLVFRSYYIQRLLQR